MANPIFISYRRDDSAAEAGRLFDDLVRAFGDQNVFMDVTGIRFGLDFRVAIDENVSGCGVLLAMVGPAWASIAHADGTLRLEDPQDFVALEIAAALKRGIPVIPVLVRQAKMPSADTLPARLKEMAYRNNIELTHPRWNSDVGLLIGALQAYVPAPRSCRTLAPEQSARSAEAKRETTALLREPVNLFTERPGGDGAIPIDAVTRHLAVFIGPLAKVVVGRLATQCANLDQLYLEASKQIETRAEQQAFLRSRVR